jgi:hypothetical protein
VHEGDLAFGVGDLDAEVAGDVVAEGGDDRVVIGPAPLAEDAGQAIETHRHAAALAKRRKRHLSRALAGTVRIVELGLRRGGQDDGGPPAQRLELRCEPLRQPGVDLRELFHPLGPVDPGEVDDGVRPREQAA